jgi:hypothetical protein
MPFLNLRPEFLEPAWATGAKQALKLGQLVFFRTYRETRSIEGGTVRYIYQSFP